MKLSFFRLPQFSTKLYIVLQKDDIKSRLYSVEFAHHVAFLKPLFYTTYDPFTQSHCRPPETHCVPLCTHCVGMTDKA